MAQFGDAATQDDDKNESRIEIQTLSIGASQYDPKVGGRVHGIDIVAESLHEKAEIDGSKNEETSNKGQMIGPILLGKLMRNLEIYFSSYRC